MANLYTNFLNEVYIPQAVSTIFWNSALFSQPFFEIVPSSACPGGPSINVLLDYAVSTSAEVYVQGAPMVAPATLSDVRANFTKDYFQESALVYGNTQAMLGGRNGSNAPLDAQKKAIDTGIKNLVNLMHSTFISDLGAQVDSSTTYSDAALVRATYGIASYEAAPSAAITRTALDTMITSLQDSANGMVDLADMVIVCAPNQVSRIANVAGVAYNEQTVVVNAQDMGPADQGRMFRTTHYNSIPIFSLPGVTNTEIYLLRRSATKIYLHEDIKVVPKDTAQWADMWLITGGANLVVEDPKRCGKLTSCTA
jgi:hypothetical protein